SGLDFTIESVQSPKSEVQSQQSQRDFQSEIKNQQSAIESPKSEVQSHSIRLGMGAIKNVGAGAVQVILDSRNAGGQFKSLDEFCQRIDLRQVGKRALEYLIKVGALDKFGERGQLLEGLDQIVNASASHFRAAESGQLS